MVRLALADQVTAEGHQEFTYKQHSDTTCALRTHHTWIAKAKGLMHNGMPQEDAAAKQDTATVLLSHTHRHDIDTCTLVAAVAHLLPFQDLMSNLCNTAAATQLWDPAVRRPPTQPTDTVHTSSTLTCLSNILPTLSPTTGPCTDLPAQLATQCC
jgi:hypothetical protein